MNQVLNMKIKSLDYDTNTWNRAQLVRYIDNKDGKKLLIIWNNVGNGANSNKQCFSFSSYRYGGICGGERCKSKCQVQHAYF